MQLNSPQQHYINRISREEYEDIIVSYFRSRGYLIEWCENKITKQVVDFKLIKDGRTTYLQCSKWKAKRIANRSGANVKAGERYWVCVDFPKRQTFIPDGVQEESMENQEE